MAHATCPYKNNYKNIVSLFYNIIVGIFVFQCKQVLNFIEQQQLCGVIYLSKINNITPSCDISVTSQYLQLGWNYSDIHLQRLNCCQTNNLSSVLTHVSIIKVQVPNFQVEEFSLILLKAKI